jgi:putative mRNA 3-end processing factor
MKDLLELRPEGLYCAAGDFHVDPWRPVPRALITHGHSDHARAGNGAYHTTVAGLPILEWRLGAQDYHAHHYGEPFELGAARVSLHPAGHVLGSAQVRVEVEGRTWVVSGDYKRDPDPTCAPFEPVRCDVFITEATFALPVYRWAPTLEVVADIIDWWAGCREHGEAAVLFCYSLGKAQRILAEIAAQLEPSADWPVFVHGAMVAGVDIYQRAGIRLYPVQPVAIDPAGGKQDKRDWTGALVLAPPSAAGSPWMRRFGRTSTAFASGWMRIRGNRRRRGHDRGFVVSDHADWPGLLRSIDDSGAARILATHGNTEALVRHLREQGRDAAALRTPFGAEE